MFYICKPPAQITWNMLFKDCPSVCLSTNFNPTCIMPVLSCQITYFLLSCTIMVCTFDLLKVEDLECIFLESHPFQRCWPPYDLDIATPDDLAWAWPFTKASWKLFKLIFLCFLRTGNVENFFQDTRKHLQFPPPIKSVSVNTVIQNPCSQDNFVRLQGY